MAQKVAARKTTNRRSESAALRRTAIINAALDEFVEKGFAAARMEDIARRAGVAKGTIYLNFSDKEALFEAIVKQEIRPKVDTAASVAASGGSLREFFELTLLPVLDDVVGTRRGAVLRLLIGEAGRFPKLAEVYYRVVVQPGLDAIRKLVQSATERGELGDDMLVEFPQLLIAPMLLAVIWTGLFERFHHLDVNRMAQAYFGHMVASGGQTKETRSARDTR
ncbi:MAG TPA: TetR/AcrR family transcriptional regulator [Bryobacteraceae bacterium]|nr:TetR/AcrR family transcriptional regulator [Bryobacteraceae bacterium]